MRKIIALFVLSFIVSSCVGKATKDQTDEYSNYNQPAIEDSSLAQPEEQKPENFDIVESADVAEKINQQVQEEIEEVEVADRVLFDLASSSLTDSAKLVLDSQVAWLSSDSTINVIIEGHCDERGAREYNIALGEKRANAVQKYLTSNGIDAARIKTISYGKERPAFVGSGEEIWSKNRRSVTVIQEKN